MIFTNIPMSREELIIRMIRLKNKRIIRANYKGEK